MRRRLLALAVAAVLGLAPHLVALRAVAVRQGLMVCAAGGFCCTIWRPQRLAVPTC